MVNVLTCFFQNEDQCNEMKMVYCTEMSRVTQFACFTFSIMEFFPTKLLAQLSRLNSLSLLETFGLFSDKKKQTSFERLPLVKAKKEGLTLV